MVWRYLRTSLLIFPVSVESLNCIEQQRLVSASCRRVARGPSAPSIIQSRVRWAGAQGRWQNV